MKRFTRDVKRFPPLVASESDPAGPPVGQGPVVDCHQHVWPAAFVEELRRRGRPPRLEGWTLHLEGEPSYQVDPADHDLGRRGELDRADGVDLALLSLSCPLGVESLPPQEAAPLLSAWHALADELEIAPGEGSSGHGLWAAIGLVEPDLDALAVVLAHPRVHGLQLPATAVSDPVALERLAPVLAVVQEAGLPVLVHPGPAPSGAAPTSGLPSWWPALTSYPAQQAAAWYAWHVSGRGLLPTLRIAFVGLAGLAPLHHERLGQRGGDLGAIDPLVYYETSSYGTRAVDAMTRVVGVDPLVHGSDRPYALPTDPGLGSAFARALFVTNPAHLLRLETR